MSVEVLIGRAPLMLGMHYGKLFDAKPKECIAGMIIDDNDMDNIVEMMMKKFAFSELFRVNLIMSVMLALLASTKPCLKI